MTPEQRTLLASSFEIMRPHLAAVGDAVFFTLFARTPEARAIFPADDGELPLIFMLQFERLTLFVSRSKHLVPINESAGSGAIFRPQTPEENSLYVPAQYREEMRAALIDTLARIPGQIGSAETLGAWSAAYDVLSQATQNTEGGPLAANLKPAERTSFIDEDFSAALDDYFKPPPKPRFMKE